MLKKSKIQTLLVSTTENGEDLIRTADVGGCLIEETGVMLRYPESDNHGTVTLLLTDTLADLKRRGDISSRMTFIDGKLLPCPYTTPQGELDFSLYTHAQSFTLNASGGRFQARFTMLAAGKQVADNVLTVEWSFVEE